MSNIDINNVTIHKKNIKNFILKVTRESEIIVSVPRYAKEIDIQIFIQKHQNWIDKKLSFYKKYPKIKQKYIDDEKFLFLGKTYKLKLIQSNTNKIKLQQNKLKLFTPYIEDFDKKEKIVDEWYKQKAEICFKKLIDKYSKYVNKEINKIRIKKMKTRWGSCNYVKGYINLNLELIKKPVYGIEYVIFHELTHLIHPNHSKEFYNYINMFMPDYKNRIKILEGKVCKN